MACIYTRQNTQKSGYQLGKQQDIPSRSINRLITALSAYYQNPNAENWQKFRQLARILYSDPVGAATTPVKPGPYTPAERARLLRNAFAPDSREIHGKFAVYKPEEEGRVLV